MLNRFPSTGFNRINLDWIMRKLKKVEDVTDNIGTAVEDAQQAAAEATTAAAGAVAAAADAAQAAEDAVAALSGIQDDVAAAVQTANAAQSTATGASNTAATALSRANSAQTAAGAAQTTADGALAQADLAREEAQYNDMVLVWTNPTPTNSFEPQTISLDLSDYDMLLVVAGATNSSGGLNAAWTTWTPVGRSSAVYRIGPRASTDARITHFYRNYSTRSASITFESGNYVIAGVNTVTTDNTQIIPTQIYARRIRQ